jgi:NAD(P)-dependent dehydrogenase (short-subunit alcohol dehydrogenase family)
VKRFEGKVALVCGASGAFGGACADALAAEGATVVLAGKTIKALEKRFDAMVQNGAAEPAIYPINFEGAQHSDYSDLAQAMQAQLGGVDYLIWAVGHWHGMESHASLQPSQWIRSLHLNCTAPWLLFQCLLPMLREKRGAALLALQSEAVATAPFSGAYGAAQSALRGWVKSAAQENENLSPRVIGAELPPLKSKLRLAAFPAESVDKVTDARLLMPQVLDLLVSERMGLASLSRP